MSAIVRPEDVDLTQLTTEFWHARGREITLETGGRATTMERRASLAPPPFVDDKRRWARAVDFFQRQRSCGRAQGEPFIVVTNIYRQLGGGFR